MNQQTSHSHSIRFPELLYKQIKELADRHHRSFNSEVIYLLEVGTGAETILIPKPEPKPKPA